MNHSPADQLIRIPILILRLASVIQPNCFGLPSPLMDPVAVDCFVNQNFDRFANPAERLACFDPIRFALALALVLVRALVPVLVLVLM